MPTLGLIIGLPIAVLLTVAALVVSFLGFRLDETGFAIGGLLVAGIVAAFTAVAFFPYQHDYHFWTKVDGDVQRVSKRLVSNGDSGMQEKIVVVVNGQPYGVNDTRASLLKVGDPAHLNCKKSYEFMSTSGWDCRWAA